MSFPLVLLILLIVALVSAAYGYRCGFGHGADCGFDDGYDFATSDVEIAWRQTAQGSSPAAAAARQPVELTIHPSHLNFPQA